MVITLIRRHSWWSFLHEAGFLSHLKLGTTHSLTPLPDTTVNCVTPLFAISPEGSSHCSTSWIVNLIGDEHRTGILTYVHLKYHFFYPNLPFFKISYLSIFLQQVIFLLLKPTIHLVILFRLFQTTVINSDFLPIPFQCLNISLGGFFWPALCTYKRLYFFLSRSYNIEVLYDFYIPLSNTISELRV